MTYKLLVGNSASALSDAVNEALSNGYSLHGSPGAIIGVNGNGHTYFQAVMKNA